MRIWAPWLVTPHLFRLSLEIIEMQSETSAEKHFPLNICRLGLQRRTHNWAPWPAQPETLLRPRNTSPPPRMRMPGRWRSRSRWACLHSAATSGEQ